MSLPVWSRLGELSGVDYTEAYGRDSIGQVTSVVLPVGGAWVWRR